MLRGVRVLCRVVTCDSEWYDMGEVDVNGLDVPHGYTLRSSTLVLLNTDTVRLGKIDQ